MDPNHYLRVVDHQRMPVRIADKGAVLCCSLSARSSHGRLYPVRNLSDHWKPPC
jgi:hypothetical protein